MCLFKIYFLVLSVLICSVLNFEIGNRGCVSGVQIGDDHYQLAQTFSIHNGFPVDMHYDVYGNLFFVVTENKGKEILSNVYKLLIDDNNVTKVKGLPKGRSNSIAIDNTFFDVYIGTDEGIYNYEYATESAELYSSKTLKVNKIIIDKDGNQYITEHIDGFEQLFFMEGSKKLRYNALEDVNELAIDQHNNIYFIKGNKLSVLPFDSLKPIEIDNIAYNGVGQISFYNEFVFVASQNVSFFHENTRDLKNIAGISSNKATSIAFDSSGNFAIGTWDGKILRFEKSVCYLRKH